MNQFLKLFKTPIFTIYFNNSQIHCQIAPICPSIPFELRHFIETLSFIIYNANECYQRERMFL